MYNNKLRHITALIGNGIHFAISLIITLLAVSILDLNTSLTCLGLFTTVSHICFFVIYDVLRDRDSFLAKVGKILLGVLAFGIAALPIFASVSLMITEEISHFFLAPLEGMWAVAVIVSFILHHFAIHKNGHIEISAFAAPLSLIISYVVLLPICLAMSFIPITFLRFLAFVAYFAIPTVLYIRSKSTGETVFGILGDFCIGILDSFDSSNNSGDDSYNSHIDTDGNDDYRVNEEVENAVRSWRLSIYSGESISYSSFSAYNNTSHIEDVYWSRTPSASVSYGSVSISGEITIKTSGYSPYSNGFLQEHIIKEIKNEVQSIVDSTISSSSYSTSYSYPVSVSISFKSE